MENVKVVIENDAVSNSAYATEYISSDVLKDARVQSSVNSFINHFLERGYSKEEIEVLIAIKRPFEPLYSKNLYVKASVSGAEKSEGFKYRFYYTHEGFTKERNEEGLRVKAEVDAYYDAIKAEREEKRSKEAERKEAERSILNTGREALKEWAMNNGDDLVRARIAEDLNWFELANAQFFLSVIPEGAHSYSDIDIDDCWPLNNATLEEIEELVQFRDYVKGTNLIADESLQDSIDAGYIKPGFLMSSIRLIRYKYVDEGNDSIVHVNVIEFGIKSPSGDTGYFAKELSREQTVLPY